MPGMTVSLWSCSGSESSEISGSFGMSVDMCGFNLNLRRLGSGPGKWLMRLILFSAPSYPNLSVGSGFCSVGWPSWKCSVHAMESFEGDQSLFPSYRPINCFQRSRRSGFFLCRKCEQPGKQYYMWCCVAKLHPVLHRKPCICDDVSSSSLLR